MGIERWGALTPERVADWISFERGNSKWTYRANDTTMPARQAEGVAGLWNKLARHRAALLADEVGTGKTLQALGVIAMLWKMKPDARVLVMAPNRDICGHWETEYKQFVSKHYRESDGLVRCMGSDRPVHAASLTPSLVGLVDALEQGGYFYLTTIHALSNLLGGQREGVDDKPKAAAAKASEIHSRIKAILDGEGFDLVVLDEAHYFRNSNGKSQRAAAAKAFFGEASGRLAKRALLMTATPSHASMDDVTAILGYVTEIAGDTPEATLKKYALRRLRRMEGRDESHDKYSYRCEKVIAADFTDPKAEMFFALYQKLLVNKQHSGEGRRYLYGYLEGFESFEVNADKQEAETAEDNANRDYNGAPDTEILKRLSRMQSSLGGLPAHPKYDALIKGCVADDVLDAQTDLHEHKHLVFVRRIPSVREITARVNAAYDEQMARKIVVAWGVARPKEVLKRWRAAKWSRTVFNRFAVFKEAGLDDFFAETSVTPNKEDDPAVYSQIAQLFVEKPSSEAHTDCSNFRSRLRKPESLFSLLLEPASDFKKGEYFYHHRKHSGDRERDEYSSAAQEARSGKAHGGAGPSAAFQKPMPTLWGLMVVDLEAQDAPQLQLLKSIAKNPKLAESFGHYVKNGFMYASPVIVELYCWYVEFRRGKQAVGAQDRYLAFLKFIKSRLNRSLALAYFRAALEIFERQFHKAQDDMKENWRSLVGLSSPAFYASGAVGDRQRLIFGFNSPFYPNVLASTSVLQEGVDLHLQCRKVHHYGIAWTPGDNEQRVGRIDRLFGKVNEHLRRDGKAELAIHYPYLARSFDEEQLASFIRQKHAVEVRMDACRQRSIHTEIDLRHSTDAWRSFLRTPGENNGASIIEDPFPFDREDRPRTDYQASPTVE